MNATVANAKMVAPASLAPPRRVCNLSAAVRQDGMAYSAMSQSTNVADSRATMAVLVNQVPVGSAVCVHRAFPDRIVALM